MVKFRALALYWICDSILFGEHNSFFWKHILSNILNLQRWIESLGPTVDWPKNNPAKW